MRSWANWFRCRVAEQRFPRSVHELVYRSVLAGLTDPLADLPVPPGPAAAAWLAVKALNLRYGKISGIPKEILEVARRAGQDALEDWRLSNEGETQ